MKKILILLVIAASIAAITLILPVEEYYNQVLEWVDSLGFVLGTIVFLLVYIFCTIFFLPGVVLTIFAGYQHGVWLGTLLSCIGGTLGCLLAFFIGKLLIAHKVRQWGNDDKFLKNLISVMDHSKHGWRVILLLRLSPLTPYALLNYLLSVTLITPFNYFISTAIGMIPGTLMYSYLGTTARVVKDIVSTPVDDGSTPSDEEGINVDSSTKMWIMVGGLIASIFIAIAITLIIRRTLNKIAEEQEQEQEHYAVPTSVSSEEPSPPSTEEALV